MKWLFFISLTLFIVSAGINVLQYFKIEILNKKLADVELEKKANEISEKNLIRRVSVFKTS